MFSVTEVSKTNWNIVFFTATLTLTPTLNPEPAGRELWALTGYQKHDNIIHTSNNGNEQAAVH